MSKKSLNNKQEDHIPAVSSAIPAVSSAIPAVSSDIVLCEAPSDKIEVSSAHPGACAVNELVNSEMEGVDSTELEKRPPPGKLTIIYAHGSTIVNEYFVVPKGYYFYFDAVKSESTYKVRSGPAKYVDKETGYRVELDTFDLAARYPKERHLAIDHADFMHQYAPGDVMTNHSLLFYPGLSTENLSESEISKDGNIKFINGIVLPNVEINPMEIIYIDGGLRHTHLQVLGPENPGLIPFEEDINLYNLINTGITLTNGDIYKLPPGHIVLRSCRTLFYDKDLDLYPITRADYNKMEPAYKTLIKQYSTGMINARNNARKPSNEPKNTRIYGPTQLFRDKYSKHSKHFIKKSMPLSQALIENAQRGRINNNKQNKHTRKHTRKQKSVARGVNNPIAAYPHPTSRVYVTTYVRQEFASKIRFYNKTVLKQYEDVGLIPEFEDMYPMDSSTGKYVRIDPFVILTPQQVYVVMMATNCHVCARNLAKLPNSRLCAKCHVVGFCEKHFVGPSRVTKHDCYSPFIKNKLVN